MKSRLLAAVLVVACASGGAACAQDAPAEFYGRVVSLESGRPIEGAQVFGPGGLTKTDAAGRFSIPTKPESEDQMLLARAEGHALHHQPLGPWSHTSEIVVALRPPRVVAVRVVGDDGQPLRGVPVRARLPFAPAYSALERADFAAVTDQEGVAIVKDLPADCPVIVEAVLPRMMPAQSRTLFPVPPDGAAAGATTIVATEGRSLRVLVENDRGKPLPGAEIRLLPLVEPRLHFGGHSARDTTKGPIRTGLTDASGAAAFELLPADPVVCEVRAAGMLTQVIVAEPAKPAAKPARVRLVPDASPPGADIPWRSSFATAREESARTGRPTFLVMTMDGEKANDWMAGHHYHEPEIVRAAREVVPLLSSAFGEGGVGADPEHREVEGKCARYGTIPCRLHQAVELEAREALKAERETFEVPRHLAYAPSGAPLLHCVFYLSERDLQRLIVRALRMTSPDDALRLARERLAGVLADASHADGTVRARGARALALLASSGDEHAAAMVQRVSASQLPAAARRDLASELHPGALRVPEVTLAELVRDPDRDVRRAVFPRLAEVASEEAVLDLLASEIGAQDAQGRDALLAALGVERKADELVVHEPGLGNRWRLVEELVGLPEAGRLQGIDGLLAAAPPSGRNRILRALGGRAASDTGAQEALLRAVRGPGAIAALRAIGKAAAGLKAPNPLLAALESAARSADVLAREEALRALADLPGLTDPAIAAESLDHPSRPVRIRAALALRRAGDRRGDGVLLQAANDPELGAEVRAALGR